jgi:tRNA (guanine37-N1)-methyltransferase
MLMQAQPVFDAHRALTEKIESRREENAAVRTIYVTPQGRMFDQRLAEELAREKDIILLCGHYEGIDERVLEEVVTDYVSIGDYVLTGGELAAMVMVDAISRLVPGVLNNDSSAETESFHNDLLEYPQYSRPEIWHEKHVPEVLLSGNHSRITKWRLEQSEQRTAERRPDLYAKYQEKQKLIRLLSKEKRKNIPIMELLARGVGDILFWKGGNVLVSEKSRRTCMLLAESEEAAARLFELVPERTEWIFVSQPAVRDWLLAQNMKIWGQCSQYLYTARETLPVRYREIRQLGMEHADYLKTHYHYETAEYLEQRLQAGVMYGAFAGERLVGFIGTHSEGSMGMLYVEQDFRRQGIARSLEAYCINRSIEKGWIPYGHVMNDNAVSAGLQEKMGFYKADEPVWWLQFI